VGRAKPIEIDTRSFTSQQQAMEFFRLMLNRYRVGDRVTSADARDLAALLKRHNEYSEKLGAGVDYFTVMVAPGFNTNCFEIVRTDGSRVDFSYQRCVDKRQT
jgi:Protein of unknown function (DUF3223)